MPGNVTLKIAKCPTCGANLKTDNPNAPIVCVYCGNTIIPVAEAAPAVPNVSDGGAQGNTVLKVEGIKTSSSALAYLEQFFEEYDWESFAYAQTLSITEIDRLARSLKVSSADDKNTWLVCFKSVYVPFLHKISGCEQILNAVIEEYKKDNLDAYSRFDAYKRIAAMIGRNKESIAASLEKSIANAAKYGASDEEINELKAEAEAVLHDESVQPYQSIEDIPAIGSFVYEKNVKIFTRLSAQGIDAEREYQRAQQLMASRNYVEAFNTLLPLKGYSNANQLIEKLDKYFLVSDVLEIEGVLYYFKKRKNGDGWQLYSTANGNIMAKPLISGISKIITNYADLLYYLDTSGKIRRYDLARYTEEKVFDRRCGEKMICVYAYHAYLLAAKSDYRCDLIRLSLGTGEVLTVVENVRQIIQHNGNKIVFTYTQEKEGQPNSTPFTGIIDLDTSAVTDLGQQKITVEGFVDNCAVCTQEAPNSLNKTLFVQPLEPGKPGWLIEQNIFSFCAIIGNKLFYYIGNSSHKTLININCDRTERREWPLYISKVLFEQGGWLYFVRRSGYNAVLCKSRLDGSKFSIIAADIEEFIKIKNGYLYYVNDVSALVKVRMDGSNLQKLCDNVETVLSVKEDKVVFVSVDDRIKIGELNEQTTKTVKSLYAVDFSGSGKIKLAYDIKYAKEYDENTVYYIAAKEQTRRQTAGSIPTFCTA